MENEAPNRHLALESEKARLLHALITDDNRSVYIKLGVVTKA